MKKSLSKYLPLLALLLFVSCSAGKYMTFDDYNKIALGENISDVQVQLGMPYEVKEQGPNKQEYIYIERIRLGEKREIFRRYILTVDNNKVIDKKVTEEVSSLIQVIGG